VAVRSNLVVSAGKPSYDGKYRARYQGGNAPALLLNIGGISYYDPQEMFLNVFKQTGSNAGWTPWGPQDASRNDTGESCYLPQILDADGNVTSLTLPTPPPGGQRFTQLSTAVFVNMWSAPGATQYYPTGNRYVTWEGKCTFVMTGDMTVPAQTLPAGVTVNGLSGTIAAQTGTTNTVVSTTAWGTINQIEISVAATTTGGMRFTLTAVPDHANYPKFHDNVETQYWSQYQGGQVFHPLFLQWLTAFPIAVLRFMDTLQTNGQLTSTYYINNSFSFTASPQAAATSATLSTPWLHASATLPITLQNGQTLNGTFTAGQTNVPFSAAVSSTCTNANFSFKLWFASNPTAGQALPSLVSPWLLPSGTYRLTFTSGEVISCTMTAGSPVVTGANPTVTCTGASFHYFGYEGWAQRAQLSNFSYASSKGAPYEICIALAKLVGSDAHVTIPASYGTADWKSFAAMCQANVGAGQRVIPEWMNEVWNGAFDALNWVIARSSFVWGSANSDGASYYAMLVCQMLQAMEAQVGDPAFDNIFIGAFGSQAANTAFLADALPAAKWVANGGTAPWTLMTGAGKKLVKAVLPAPYYGNGDFLPADITHAQGTGDTSGDLIASLTQNPVNGYSYTAQNLGGGALPAGGWFGIAAGWIANHVAFVEQYGSPMIICYEGSNSFDDINNAAGQASVIYAMMRDARMANAEQAYYEAMRNAGCTVVAKYSFCSPYTGGRAWGAIESVMQPCSPHSSAPARWQAMLQEFYPYGI
jgi:hypothetical protein